MESVLRELEGTWEEVSAHARELRGHRVRLVVLDIPTGADAIADRLARLERAAGRLRGLSLSPEALDREHLYGDEP